MKAKVSLSGNNITQGAEVEASAKEATEFINSIIPGFVKDFGGVLSDQVKFWRFKNQINIIQKVKNKIESSGLMVKEAPLKVLLPIIENSSLEEDESIQDKWANLLANSVTNHEVSPNYPEILKELSPIEVSILDQLFNEAQKESDYKKRKELQFSKQAICSIYKLTQDKADLLIENLFRLNLCQSPAGSGIAVGEYKFALRTNEIFEFTSLGYDFVRLCRFP